MSSEALLQTIETLTEDVTQRDVTIKALRLTTRVQQLVAKEC